ncbi:MAG: cell division topological specificity factor MinE [Lachnospiraceae bacterium]
MFLNRKRHSGLIAKDRLKLLLVSERLNCSPQMMTMLKNDVVQAAGKYFNVDKDEIEIRCRHDKTLQAKRLQLQISIMVNYH